MQTIRKFFICLALALSIPAAADAQGFKFWQIERFQKGLALSADQMTRLEAVYQAAEPTLRAQKAAFDKYEQKLSKVISDPKSDESQVLAATERLEAARTELSKTRTLQLFRIRRILTDAQNAKMKEMHDHDRNERDRRPRGDDSRKDEARKDQPRKQEPSLN
jgi:Spy/CpxP family protein refolding chaperone